MTVVDYYVRAMIAEWRAEHHDATPGEIDAKAAEFRGALKAMSRHGAILTTLGVEPDDRPYIPIEVS